MVPVAMSSPVQDDQVSSTLATAISPQSNALLLTIRLLLFSHPLLDLTSHNILSDFPAEVALFDFIIRFTHFAILSLSLQLGEGKCKGKGKETK